MKELKKVLISISFVITVLLTPGISLALSDNLEFNVHSKSILDGYAKLALQEFYLHGPCEEKKIPSTINFNNPILYTFKYKNNSNYYDNIAAIIYKDTKDPKSYNFVLFKLQDGMVLQIIARSSAYSDDIFKDIKNITRSTYEFQ